MKTLSAFLLTAALLLAMLVAGCQAPAAPAPAVISPTAVTPLPPGMTAEQAATLGSLEQVDAYPLYAMHYQGAYAPAAALGPSEPASRLAWGCSLFAAFGDPASQVYGRNFDWEYSPAMLLFTSPPDGYASVAMVDITYLGFTGDTAKDLVGRPLQALQSLLGAPALPFDGMNAKGLVVGMAAVPDGGMVPDPGKTTLGSLEVIRAILDHAANVDEAVNIIANHNIDMEGGPPLHYLLADAAGKSALVEFYQGQMKVTYNTHPWHQATNFIVAAHPNATQGQCYRYDLISRRMQAAQGKLTSQAALELLAGVAQDITQWSVVYEPQTGKVHVAMGRQYDQVHTLQLSR